ncbi:Calpastatin [Varanus komodoensis]|nr:Calpastatin [Varanus komodoensis]
MAFASWWYATHGDKNASGAAGDKKGGEAAEKKPANTGIADSSKTKTSGVSSISKTQSSSTVAAKTPSMKPSETKAAQKSKTESEKVVQLTKAKGPSKPMETEPKQPSTGKGVSGQIDKSTTQLTSLDEGKAKTDKKPSAAKAAVAAAGAAGAVAAAGLTAPSAEIKENKSATTTPAADTQPAQKSDMDAALDDLIDTLGSAEEQPTAPAYTGPEVLDPMSSLYIEELGKRESTIPPEYRKLLESKGDGKVVPPPVPVGEFQPTMTDDDLADALSSGFTCSVVSSAGEKNIMSKEKSAKEGELLQAESTTLVRGSAPPKEKKPKLEEAAISDSALEALVDTLGMPEPEPEVDLSSIVEVEEPKAKERKEKKAGERDDTIPPEYRLKPVLDKDGKPLLPKPEEKPKPLSESELVDEFSKDFVCPTPPTEISKPSKSADEPKKPAAAESKTPKETVSSPPTVPSLPALQPSEVPTKPSAVEPKKISTEEVVSAAAVHSVKSSAPSMTPSSTEVPDEALEALAGSLGKKDRAPEEKKPAVDKVKEKAKQEEREKLGEDEETIPPDYRLTEAKGSRQLTSFSSSILAPQQQQQPCEDKDGKPLLPKPQEKPQPLSESELLDALSEGFSCSSAPASKASPAAAPQKSTGASKPDAASAEEVISSASVSAVHTAALPPPTGTPAEKELESAADLLADSLGQREPDPDENKPIVDKVKEKAKSEHKDKLGERDDTIPPEYRHILDSDEKGKPIKPTDKDGEKPKEQKKPADDSAAIDALSGDFDNCGKPPVSQKTSAKDEKTKDAAVSKPVRKEEKKSKSPKKGKEQSSSGKSEKQKKS